MVKRHVGVDGFVPRRTPGVIGEVAAPKRDRKLPRAQAAANGIVRRVPVSAKKIAIAEADTNALRPTASKQHGLSRADIDDSLKQIDAEPQQPVGKRATRKRGGVRPQRRKIIKRVIIGLLLLGLLVGGWVVVKGMIASGSVFKGDIFGLVQSSPLKQDEHGQSNILIFGTSEDDEGGEHPGAFLTDSIMVLSVNQTTKKAHMVSIPRDLWVSYGTSCDAGNQGKINELYGCFAEGGKNDEAGSVALAKKVTEVTGLDIQYHVHVNYTVVREAVDAVGGVDVDVKGNGDVPYGVKPGSILDRNFDWKCNYKCYYVKYEPGVHHMDGEHALAFMRARNAQGGYGLAQGNFDREQNQQKVIKALREKSLSVGTLSNPGKVTSLIDALGNNLKTDIETKELRTVLSLASDIPNDAIQSISLVDEKDSQMTTAMLGGVSIVRPVDGIEDYTGIKKYIRKQISADAMTLEEASVVVLNGTGVAGQAQAAADKLSAMGFTIDGVDNAPAGKYARRVVYQRNTTSYPATRAKLTSMYGEIRTGVDQFGVADTVQFVIVVGEADATE